MGTFSQDQTSRFIDQTVRDSPCRLRVKEKDSLFSLAKWGGSASLSFGLGEDWTGQVTERKNEIIVAPYANPDRKHLIRRLDDERFEYDVILLEEPETNRIRIELSFPDGLEFFRQPSLEMAKRKRIRCANEIIDSYAVYWKERNGSFKTGKFCHICRPLIRDARGRTVWGGLDISGSTMTVTIPERWLAEAAYPVVVDPVIGTQSRGALNSIDWNNEGDPTIFMLDCSMGLNRFTATQPIQGQCTSYVYSYVDDDMNGQAVCYSNSGSAPDARLSRDEQLVSFDRTTPLWVPSTFNLSRPIAAGETFWYGYNARYGLKTYYDLGGTFRKMDTLEYNTVPDSYSDYGEVWSVIMSIYFEYTLAQNYSRVLGAGLGVAAGTGRRISVVRLCPGLSDAAAGLSRMVGIIRRCLDSLAITALKETVQTLLRACASAATGVAGMTATQVLLRFCASVFSGSEILSRCRGLYRFISGTAGILERIVGRMILKKEELIFVSRLTKELTFKGDLL